MKVRFEILLAVFVLAIAAMLLLPLPTPLIDVLIVLNLAFSFLILLISLYLPNALSLLSFPTLLLLSTLFRLALNVASSRLILAQGDAGVVIEAFGTLLVGGQIAVGIIIFVIITVVNFLVIARGSARVSEVAARFALDALPGKQATIDSDLRGGLISNHQAQQRREALRKESQLYGAMDGSMKFVQGDAIAGFLIILTNIIGGLSIALSNGMPLAEAFQTYTILTVGDGLVAQVPALLIAICAGIVVTRVSSSETATLGEDVAADLLARPVIIVTVGGLLAFFALLPGVPALPFLAVGGTLVLVGMRMRWAAANGVGFTEILSTRDTFPSPLALESSRASTAARALPAPSSSNAGLPSQLGKGNKNKTAPIVTPGGAPTLAPDRDEAALHLFLDRHALFSSFERNLSQSYSYWNDLRETVRAEFGVMLPKLWIGADFRSSSGTINLELHGIFVSSLRVPLDSHVVTVEPAHARALGISVESECLDPLSGRVLSWVNASQASRVEPFPRWDAVQLAMRSACYYLLSHPEELITISETHSALMRLEETHPGLFDSSLDRRFINPARATEINRELLRAGFYVGDTRQLIEDLAHYCATYAKSELTASDFDLGDIVLHIRKLRSRHLAACMGSGKGANGLSPIVRFLSEGEWSAQSSVSSESEARDARTAVRSGSLVVGCVVKDHRLIGDCKGIEATLPHVTVLAESEVALTEIKTAQFAVLRERAEDS